MQCSVCGQDYGLTHRCAGVAPLANTDELAPPPPLRFAPFHYFSEAFKILCWDDVAVRRASRDNNSLLYGFLIFALAAALPFAIFVFRALSAGYRVSPTVVLIRFAITAAVGLLWIVLQIGLSHVLAKTLFDAKGSYIAVMRAYLLGQLFQCFVIIPVVGPMAAGLGGIAVLMLVFEEVDGIERMKAFGLAATIGVTFWILFVWVINPALQSA
jgi:hypothetical protein